jgi:C-terminal processing protease CtpA/Prc
MRFVIVGIALGTFAAAAVAQQPSKAQRTDRLAALARLDAAVRYFHPSVATQASGWDIAFATRVLDIADAPSRLDYAARINRLLATLGDPLTQTSLPREWTTRRLVNGAVMVDLRGGGRASPAEAAALAKRVSIAPLEAPAQRALKYNGFPTNTFQSSGGYGLMWRVIPGERFEGGAARDANVVFIADSASVIPAIALALRRVGRASIIGVGVTSVVDEATTYRLDLGQNYATVRLATHADSLRIPVDTTVEAADVNAAAAAWATRPPAAKTFAAIDTVAPLRLPPVPTDAAWRALYPAAGFRVLAASRLWSTISWFFPYKSLMGGDWNAQLRVALPTVVAARDSLEYAKALAAFASHINDSHVNVGGATLFREWYGQAAIGAGARLIEGKLVITRIVDSSATKAGLVVGDVVTSVDGETVAARMARLTPFVAASTPQALRNRLQGTLMNGRDTTSARLVVIGANGTSRALTVPRSPRFAQLLAKHRTGSLFRILPGNVGYVDLDRLPTSAVDSMFRTFANTKGIVFDMRGYPMGTAWAIAPVLNVANAPTTAAKFRRLVVMSPDTSMTTIYAFDQPIPSRSPGRAAYTGKTAMLIDERAISQAEHTGLFFEAANATPFVGSPTMGANGDVTTIPLPGNLNVTFTGHDVRHADGRQLQRVGLQPNVAVSPTIAGIRAGRDEVLEAAVKLLGGTGEIPVDTVREALPVLVNLAPEPLAEGWQAGGNAASFRGTVDRSVVHSGTGSGHVVARTIPATGLGTLTQVVAADSLRGKRIRFSAYIKTRNAGGAILFLQVLGESNTSVGFANSEAQNVTGTSDWVRRSFEIDIASNAVRIGLGFAVIGAGEGWVDDVELDIVGDSRKPDVVRNPGFERVVP